MNTPNQDPIESSDRSNRIVILADDPTSIDALARGFKESNFEVFFTHQTPHLNLTLAEQNPEAVILDLDDTTSDSLAITRMLRASPDFRDLPIFFVSTDNSLRNQLLAAQSGADGIFCKPLIAELVIVTVTTRAERYRSNKKLQRDMDRLVNRLNHTAQEALAASQAKAQFIASVSHELRTPLNGIIGMSDILLESELPSSTREATEVIRSSGSLLLGLINDVLDFSKIEAGQVELAPTTINISQLGSELRYLHGHRAEQKNITFDIALPANLQNFCGDRVKILQILNNLIGNSIKFTENGQVLLKVNLHSNNDDKNILEFQVRDTGIGIAPEDYERIFQPFVQGQKHTSRQPSGTGLGHAVARRLARAMGGDVHLDRNLGQGSCFTFSLPITLETATQTIPITPAPRENILPLPKLEVLVVDDNEINRVVAGRLLSSLGCRPHFAHDGESALIALRNRQFHLILMDCQMPDPNGFAVTRIVRNEPGPNQTTKIMAVTASAFLEDRTLCLEAGMDAYLAKPVTRSALLEALREIRQSSSDDVSGTNEHSPSIRRTGTHHNS